MLYTAAHLNSPIMRPWKFGLTLCPDLISLESLSLSFLPYPTSHCHQKQSCSSLRVRTSLLRSQSSTLSQFSGIVFLSLFFQSSFFLFLFYMVVESIMEKAMAPHSSTLAWKIPWTEEPGGLQSMGSLRVGYDWASSLSFFTFHYHALEKEMATDSSALAWRIPGTGEPRGLPSMVSHRIRHDWNDLAAAAESINNVVSVSGVQQSDSVIHASIFFFKFFSHLNYCYHCYFDHHF